MGGRKKPMGEQAVPEWGLHPWMEIVSNDDDIGDFIASKDPSRHKPSCWIVTHPEDITCTCGALREEEA